MPVDKFGRTDGGGSYATNRIVSSGLTLSQATNTFLRRDGGNDATADISLNSHKLTNVADPINNKDVANKEYVDANTGINRVLRTGDTMTGDLALTSSGTNTERNLGCKTITDGQTFNLWLGTSNVRLAYTDIIKLLHLVVDNGFQIAKPEGILFSIGINPDPRNAATFYVPIKMGGRPIIGVSDPVNAQDAATKNYVDTADNLRLKLDGTTPMTGTLNMGRHRINNVVDPTTAQQAATKIYVDTKRATGVINGTTQLRELPTCYHLDCTAALGTSNGDILNYLKTVTNPTGGTISFYSNYLIASSSNGIPARSKCAGYFSIYQTGYTTLNAIIEVTSLSTTAMKKYRRAIENGEWVAAWA